MVNYKANSYTEITEVPGQKISSIELDMIQLRYHTAVENLVDEGVVLEVGCGPGLGANAIVRGGAKSYHGIDINPEIVDLAKINNQSIENIEFSTGDAHSLPWPDNFFDAVYCFEAIFYFNDISKCLEEISRVLKPGGVFLLCLPNKRIKGFVPSKFSASYYDNIEIGEILAEWFEDIEIFGAYPLKNEVVKNLRSLRIKIGQYLESNRVLRGLKNQIKIYVFKRNIRIPERVSLDDGPKFELELLERGDIDNIHKIIYVKSKAKVKINDY